MINKNSLWFVTCVGLFIIGIKLWEKVLSSYYHNQEDLNWSHQEDMFSWFLFFEKFTKIIFKISFIFRWLSLNSVILAYYFETKSFIILIINTKIMPIINKSLVNKNIPRDTTTYFSWLDEYLHSLEFDICCWCADHQNTRIRMWPPYLTK